MAATYQGPIIVTVLFTLFYYASMLNVLRVKAALAREYKARGEKFDRYFGNDRHMLAADRIQLNTLEHMTPFLLLLWLHAVLVDTRAATIAGGIYVASRVAYPFLIGAKLGRNIPLRVLAATFTGYGVIGYFAFALARAALAA